MPLYTPFGFTEGTITEGNDNRLSTAQVINVKKNPGDGEFSSIAVAITYINTLGDASAIKPYLVDVGPGVYTESLITIPAFVNVKGSDNYSTIVQPDAINHNIFELSNNSFLSFVQIQNAGANQVGVHIVDAATQSVLHKISLYNCDTAILCEAIAQKSFVYLEYVDANYYTTTGLKISAVDGHVCDVNSENYYSYPSSSTSVDILVEGPDATLTLNTFGVINEGTPGTCTGVQVTNGGYVDISAGYFVGYSTAILVDTVGINPNPQVHSMGLIFLDCTTNLNIANDTASGHYTGYTDYTKVIINPLSSFFITNKDSHIITVAKKGGDFTSVKDAVTAVTALVPSLINSYKINVGPGIFSEDPIVFVPYIDIHGSGAGITIIKANSPTQHIIVGSVSCSLFDVTLTDASGASGVAVYCQNITGNLGEPFLLDSCTILNCETCIFVDGSIGDILLQINFCRFDPSFTNGLVCTTSGGYVSQIFLTNTVVFHTGPTVGNFLYIAGSGTKVFLSALSVINDSLTGTALRIREGAKVVGIACSFKGFAKGIWVEDFGDPVEVFGQFALLNNVYDILIDQAATTGSITGSADADKVLINPLCNIALSYADPTTGQVTLQSIYQGSRSDRLLNLSDLIRETTTLGLVSGGAITLSSGRIIDVAGGKGFLLDPTDLYVKEITWTPVQVTIPVNETHYIFVNTNSVVTTSASVQNLKEVIILGRAHADTTILCFIEPSSLSLAHYSNENETYLRDAIGPIFSTGCIVSEGVAASLLSQGITYTAKTIGSIGNAYSVTVTDTGGLGLSYTEPLGVIDINLGGSTPTTAQVVSLLSGSAFVTAVETTPGSVIAEAVHSLINGVDRGLDITGGKYFYGINDFTSVGGTGIPFETYYRDGSGNYINVENVTVVDNLRYNTGSGLVNLTAVAQVVTNTPAPFILGVQTFIQTINDVPYTFTSDGTPTVSEVVTGLSALINADTNCAVAATGTVTLILTAKTPGIAFTHSESANITPDPSPTPNVAYYAKHSLYMIGDTGNEKYFFVYSQAQYVNLIDAQEGDIPTPPCWLCEAVTLIATIITQKHVLHLIQITDERPRIGFKPSSVSSVTSHGDLSGLNSDDHKQYVLVNGTRAMTGPLNMGGQTITNVGTVDGVDVATHMARHLPNSGTDALTTAAPTTNLSSSTTNYEGGAASLARSDHRHAITNGNLSETTSSILTISNGTGSVLGSGTTIAVAAATDAVPGYLTAGDHTSFAGGVITANAALPSASFTDAAVTGKLLTGFVSGAGTVAVEDSILSAINKLDGNDGLNLKLTGGTLTGDTTLANAKAIIFTEKSVGTDTISLRAPDSVTTSYTLQLPPAVSAAGGVLTDVAGNGITTWVVPTAYQPLDSDLTALANTATTGLYVVTGVGTSTTRTATGTSNTIAITNGDGISGNPTITIANNPIFPGTASATLVTGTTAQRPGSPTNGMVRFNSYLGFPEMYITSTGWVPIFMTGGRSWGTLWDDFLKDAIASNQWEPFVSGTGAGSVSVNTGVDSTSRAIGVEQLTTGTTSSGISALLCSTVSDLFGFGYKYLEMRVQVPTLSTAGQEFDVFIGFSDNSGLTGIGIDGAYFHYNRNASVNWQMRTVNNTASTVTPTAVVVTAAQWYKLAVQANAAGTQIDFFIDDVNVGNIVLNIPTGVGRTFGPAMKIEKSAGTTARTLLIDYVQYFYNITTPR